MSGLLFRARPSAAYRRRIVCFPYAGGGSGIFRTWAAHAPADVEILPVRLPGRETRFEEEPYRNWAQVVADVCGAFRPLADLPLVLFGHSFGAMLAFEVARELVREERDRNVSLVVSACAAPGREARFPAPLNGSSADLWAWLGLLAATPAEILADADIRMLLEPTLRADLALAEEWRGRRAVRIPLPITTFRGVSDKLVSRAEMEAWSACTSSTYRSVEFEGDHFFIREFEAEVVDAIVDGCVAA